MAFLLPCPHCAGERESHEFWYGGEFEALPADLAGESAAENFSRVWLRENLDGERAERWFHFAGCNRWITVVRDTRSHRVAPLPRP
jgi:heterotetrameric sarcosine oxidase delta subunit